MHSEDPVSIYRAVCESMTCGVMLIDGQGRIETFNPAANPAASELLGLDRDAVLHGSSSRSSSPTTHSTN